jgi:hypothetical protein
LILSYDNGSYVLPKSPLQNGELVDVETWVNNTFASLRLCVKLERERNGAKNKNPPVGDHVV